MKKYSLSAINRDLIGRKVKNLRAQGNTPATVYGRNVKSISVTIPTEAFTKVYAQAGETGLIELSVGSDVKPVLIHTVQKDPVKSQLLHVEFYQVDLKQKVKTKVPLELVGDAPAVMQKVGVLLTLIDEVDVEALPTDLPEKISIDVSRLAEVGQEVKVADLTTLKGVTILTDANLAVVRVGPLVSKEAEAQAAAEAAEAAAKAAEAAAAAPAAGTPGEAPPAEGKPAEAAAPEASKPAEEKKP